VSKNIFNFRISYIFLPSPLTISTEANTNISNEVRPPIEPIGDLTGATIRITSNKFKGLTGIITERRTYQHAFIECDQKQQLIDPVHISDIEIITHPPKSTESELTSTIDVPEKKKKKKKMDLESSQVMAQEIVAIKEKYIGALVRIVNDNKDNVVGTVKKIIYGDYYITDNPDIKGAVRKGYEVLEYPPGFNGMRDGNEEEEKLKEVADAKTDEGKMDDDAKTDEKSSENLEEVVEEKVNKKPSSDPSGEDAKSSENLEEVVEENNKKPSSTDSSGEDAKANDKQEEEEEEEEEDSNVIQVVPPIAAAVASSFSTSLPNMPKREQNLIGATIRIKKGRYAGLVGVINERQNIRRIQLDSLPLPVKFDDIEGKMKYYARVCLNVREIVVLTSVLHLLAQFLNSQIAKTCPKKQIIIMTSLHSILVPK